MISIVIPYFQRSPGVLRKALSSVAAQQACPLPVHVIVVDDASPVPALGEVAAAALPDSISTTVIIQPNGGPGAARNTGLDAVPTGTRYVAFLDSDDEWSPDHLARAVAALEQGFDFYFADLYQLDQTVGAFARAGRIRPSDHPRLQTPHDGLHAYKGDMFDQVLRGNVVGTPTVMYRWDRFSALRFRDEFTTAGEDYLFWMSLASQGARVAFSSQIETTCGKGVNVFAGSGWGTDGHLLRVHQEIRYRQAVHQNFSLDTPQRLHIRRDLQRLRLAFVRDVLHRLTHRKGLPVGLLKAHAKVDPLTFAGLPWSLLKILSGR
ncbi:MAG: glycosyltransferase family 2 protein [Rhodoferax sp.]